VPREVLIREIERLSRELEIGGPPAQTAALAARLHRRLLEPVAEKLAGVRRLIIVPDRVTRKVAWAALRRDPQALPLVSRFVLRVSPSASTILADRPSLPDAPVSSESRLVAVGDPARPGGVGGMPRLPAARREVREIGERFRRPRLLLGEDATRAEFLETLDRADVLHVASHFTAGRDAWSTRIELTPEGDDGGGLLARDVARLRLPRLRLAVLSGCATGREGETSFEGTFSVAGAFLAAGADEVIASLWPVGDESTRRLMNELYHRLLSGLPADEALREAQIALASEADGPDAPGRPGGDWAAFQLISLTLPRTQTPPSELQGRKP
jgi:CHAT domain-containing protein